MSIKYQDLKPVKAKIILDDKEYRLRPFSIGMQVLARDEFATADNSNGLDVLSERAQDLSDFEWSFKLAWFLMDMKHQNKIGTYENFIELINKDSDGQYKKAMEIYSAVVKTMGVSQPQIDEIAEDIELKKSLAADS